MNTITRKIELRIDQENYKEVYETLYKWNEITFRAYNYVATHLYVQYSMGEFFYLQDDFKTKFVDRAKDEEGVLTTSKRNTTYQFLSQTYKGQIPSAILNGINNTIVSTFSKEQKEYFSGKRSLRTYKKGVPIPLPAQQIRNIQLTEDEKNYTFNLFKMNFRTNFGRDLSGNKLIFERSLDGGDYKLCDSSLQIKGTKIFLLAVFQFESEKKQLNPKKSAFVRLGVNNPMVVTIGKKTYNIGTKEEFLHRRLQIQAGRRRLQAALKYNTGGKGRAKKLKTLENWEEIEKNYVSTKLHTYSKELIKLCLDNKIGNIVILNQDEEFTSFEEQRKTILSNTELSPKEKKELIAEKEFVIRNWSYYSLNTKIEYKAKIEGIKVEQAK